MTLLTTHLGMFFFEFAELFMFLLVAMTFINTMTERNVFEVLRVWLVTQGFDYRKIFIITGILSFFISPIADNLTTALLMCAVVMAVAKGNKSFYLFSLYQYCSCSKCRRCFFSFW